MKTITEEKSSSVQNLSANVMYYVMVKSRSFYVGSANILGSVNITPLCPSRAILVYLKGTTMPSHAILHASMVYPYTLKVLLCRVASLWGKSRSD